MEKRFCVVERRRMNIKRIPLKKGLFALPRSPKRRPEFIASKCVACGEIFFPKRDICQNCQEQNLKEIRLKGKGKIYSFTIVMQRPASHYRGPVPYAFGWVELSEGVRVESLYTGCNLQKLKIGLEVELVVEKLHIDDAGNEVICHKFRPIKAELE